MTLTKGYAAEKARAPLASYTFERRQPGEHDVAIEIRYCGICHTDIHQVRDEWGGGIFPMVPGHEIAGIVSAVGSKVTRFKAGDTVGIGCFVDSCRDCPECRRGLEQYCAKGAAFTYNSRLADGSITMGGYSENIVVDENYVLRIPGNLPLAAAAPLLCAGITLYSPLRHWQAGPDKKVAIIGLGGLGHMGIKIAHALGAEVTVFSQSTRKQADAKRLGADYFHATSDPATFEKLQNRFDLILNTVSADVDWNQYVNLLKTDGALVILGVPTTQIPVAATPLILGRKSIAGSVIGGIEETQEMLDFCSQHNIVSDIEMIPVQKINEAYERILKSDVRYRFVIDMESLRTDVSTRPKA